MTPSKAVWRGMWAVNGPVFLLLFGPATAAAVLGALLGYKDEGSMIALVLVPLSFAGAWIFWSVQIPRWRVWAYRRVDDLDDLKAQAVAAGLIWPDGHFFERTEYRPKLLRDELARFERQD